MDREGPAARLLAGLRRWARGLGETAVIVGAFVLFGVVWAVVLGLAADWLAGLRVIP